ncbi:MAG TPA: tRNA guanosine(15) transglycosylase TgtA [Thermoplasmata archaeon]|nr:tRNA guanosine(15) transglycosylase TgtA [Thermoplasmata archaeon]
MVDFELLDRDGLARRGRFTTPHGTVETPALLPVVHPDPARQPVSPEEMRNRLGIRAVISSAYITWRTPPLRSVAEHEGIHRLLRFDGTVMTDSGAFQQHAYGSVEVTPEEILAFQNAIGTDIATVLDVFTEPEESHDATSAALRETVARARASREQRSGLLAVPVQGGLHPDLRAESARAASELGDVLAVGGVVPLMEQYRFPELVRVLAASRPTLAPEGVVHLFGTGHPMTFALAALFGVDLFDSSAYHKFARRGSLMTPDGTVALEEIRENLCHCFLCSETPLTELSALPAEERERRVAYHNLWVSVEEVARVRQAIREGTLWELAERRSAAHPSLRAGLREAMARSEVFLPTEPDSRRAFREVIGESRDRPVAVRFRRAVQVYRVGRTQARTIVRFPLRPEYLERLPTLDRSGRPLEWESPTPFGPVPVELTDIYPVGPYLGIDEYLDRPRHRSPSAFADAVREAAGSDPEWDRDRDWTPSWNDRQVERLLEWRYGRMASSAVAQGLRAERSRRTGRLRAMLRDGQPEFVVGTDGLPRPTFRGGARLHGQLGSGRERVVVHDDAVPFVREGKSLFSTFAVRADPSLVPGASALLVDESDGYLGVGRLLLAPHEMGRLHRGVAVRVTAHARSSPLEPEE